MILSAAFRGPKLAIFPTAIARQKRRKLWPSKSRLQNYFQTSGRKSVRLSRSFPTTLACCGPVSATRLKVSARYERTKCKRVIPPPWASPNVGMRDKRNKGWAKQWLWWWGEDKTSRPMRMWIQKGRYTHTPGTAGAILDPTLRRKVITAFPLFDFATSLC